MKTEYKVIGSDCLDTLSNMINQHISGDWKVSGDFVAASNGSQWRFYQRLVKEIDDGPCKPSTPPANLQWKPIPEHFPGDGNRIEAECHLGNWVITHEPASEVFHILKTRIRGMSRARQASMLFFDQQAAMKFCDDFTHNAAVLAEAV